MASKPTERIIGRIEAERQAEMDKQIPAKERVPRLDSDMVALYLSLSNLTHTIYWLGSYVDRAERWSRWRRYREREEIARNIELFKRVTLVPSPDAPEDWRPSFYSGFCDKRIVTLPVDEVEHVEEHEVHHAWSIVFPRVPNEIGRLACNVSRVATEMNTGHSDIERIYAVDGSIHKDTFGVESFTDGTKDDPLVTIGKSALEHVTGLANQARDYLTNLSNE